MTINYKGIDQDFGYRLAEINYDADTEQTLMDRIQTVMMIQGYDIDQVTDGYASCKVDDMQDYKDFVTIYKTVKKAVKSWIKFGF